MSLINFNEFTRRPQEESINESEKHRFSEGDHVHQVSRAGENDSLPSRYGVVKKATSAGAHVHWEDGEKTIHSHSDGKLRKSKADETGHHSSYQPKISHNEVYNKTQDGKPAQWTRLENGAHKEYIKNIRAKRDAADAHHASHQKAVNQLASRHATSFKPHHLQAIHDILDRSSRGED